jgi:hypothetical protein
MNTRFLLLTLTLLFTVRIYARDKTDVMVMTNGDRPTCEVKGLDAGVLYVSFEAFTAPVRGLCAGQCVSPTLFILYRHRGTRQYLSRYTTFAKLITFAVELRPKYVGTEPDSSVPFTFARRTFVQAVLSGAQLKTGREAHRKPSRIPATSEAHRSCR